MKMELLQKGCAQIFLHFMISGESNHRHQHPIGTPWRRVPMTNLFLRLMYLVTPGRITQKLCQGMKAKALTKQLQIHLFPTLRIKISCLLTNAVVAELGLQVEATQGYRGLPSIAAGVSPEQLIQIRLVARPFDNILRLAYLPGVALSQKKSPRFVQSLQAPWKQKICPHSRNRNQ